MKTEPIDNFQSSISNDSTILKSALSSENGKSNLTIKSVSFLDKQLDKSKTEKKKQIVPSESTNNEKASKKKKIDDKTEDKTEKKIEKESEKKKENKTEKEKENKTEKEIEKKKDKKMEKRKEKKHKNDKRMAKALSAMSKYFKNIHIDNINEGNYNLFPNYNILLYGTKTLFLFVLFLILYNIVIYPYQL